MDRSFNSGMESKKGFTLIEVLITLTIMFIVIGIAFPLFNSNFKALRETEIKSDLQRDAYNVIKCISDSASETRSITTLSDFSGKEYLYKNTNGELEDMGGSITDYVSIGEIEFETDDDSNLKRIRYKFKLENNKLNYKKTINEDKDYKEISSNIKSIEIKPVDESSDKKISQCKGLSIKITLVKKNIQYQLESKVYFRNFKNEYE